MSSNVPFMIMGPRVLQQQAQQLQRTLGLSAPLATYAIWMSPASWLLFRIERASSRVTSRLFPPFLREISAWSSRLRQTSSGASQLWCSVLQGQSPTTIFLALPRMAFASERS